MTRLTPLFALVVTLSSAVAAADPDDDASLAWQLRPVTLDNVARIDSAAAVFNDRNRNLDLAVATTLTGTYRLSDAWAPMLRLGLVGNDAPGAALDGGAFANPLVGTTYARELGTYRLAVFAGATIPVGTGSSRTHAASMTARPADRAMFAVAELAAIAGVDFAYVNRDFTAQGEVTLVQAVRVRGDEMPTGSLSTRASVGVHLAYVVGWHVAVGGDLHYEDTLTASVGVRTQLALDRDTRVRPGIAVLRGLDGRGLDAPPITARTTAVMIDIPVTF